MNHSTYMHRCLQLAKLGEKSAAPNPFVGCVVVHQHTIIGEGWHYKHGEPHAEVNAIQSVKNKALLTSATVYVNLEPCAHFGKTPPCADLLIKHKVKKVVIGTLDPFSKVNGAGVLKLQQAGIEVQVGVLEKECLELNKVFFTFHNKKRPFITLKWAQTLDGFFDKTRKQNEQHPNWISNQTSKTFVHQLRAIHSAILVGSNTVLVDNPSLTTRLVAGQSPVRFVLDREAKTRIGSRLYTDGSPTVVFGKPRAFDVANVPCISVSKSPLEDILGYCYKENLTSLLVEGGAELLQHFIDKNLWDTAYIVVGNKTFGTGLKAPVLRYNSSNLSHFEEDKLLTFLNT